MHRERTVTTLAAALWTVLGVAIATGCVQVTMPIVEQDVTTGEKLRAIARGERGEAVGELPAVLASDDIDVRSRSIAASNSSSICSTRAAFSAASLGSLTYKRPSAKALFRAACSCSSASMVLGRLSYSRCSLKLSLVTGALLTVVLTGAAGVGLSVSATFCDHTLARLDCSNQSCTPPSYSRQCPSPS